MNERNVYVALRSAQNLLDLIGGASSLQVRVHDPFAAETIAQEIRAVADLKVDSWIKTNAQFFTAMAAQILANTLIRIFVGLTVALGIASVLLSAGAIVRTASLFTTGRGPYLLAAIFVLMSAAWPIVSYNTLSVPFLAWAVYFGARACAHGRNAVFYGDKAIDRSPCGTGTSARMAQLHAKGRLKVGDMFVHESCIGSRFIGRIEAETEIGGQRSIVPSIEGSAYATGRNEIWIDDDDPFPRGFQVV